MFGFKAKPQAVTKPVVLLAGVPDPVCSMNPSHTSFFLCGLEGIFILSSLGSADAPLGARRSLSRPTAEKRVCESQGTCDFVCWMREGHVRGSGWMKSALRFDER